MRGGGRRLAWGLTGLLCVGLVTGCDATTGTATASRVPPHASAAASPSASSTTSPDGSHDATPADDAALRALMATRAQAVKDGDLAAFVATVDPRQPHLVQSQTTLFKNLLTLPLAALTYVVTSTYLVPADVPGHDPVLHPQVLEQLQLAGTLRGPVSNKLDLTFVERGDQWLVGAERAPGAKGSVEDPQERPWFGARIAAYHDHDLTVLVDASAQDQLTGLVSTVRSGIQRDADLLGVDPDERLLVDATSNGEAKDFGAGVTEQVGAVTFPLLTAGPDGRVDDLAGKAVKINPHHLDELVGDSQLLWHELTHALLFKHIGTAPAWLNEGVAAWSEWQPTRMSGLVVPADLYDRAQLPPHELPTDGVFYGKPDVDYLIGQAAVQWLVDRSGVPELLDLLDAYDDLASGASADSATPAALRKVYGISEKELVAGAYATLATLHRD